jgi:hypothetical protein
MPKQKCDTCDKSVLEINHHDDGTGEISVVCNDCYSVINRYKQYITGAINQPQLLSVLHDPQLLKVYHLLNDIDTCTTLDDMDQLEIQEDESDH